MMPLASECCKCSKLLVDLLLEPYSDCTWDTGILKKLYCSYNSYLRLSECVPIMDNNY